MKVTRRLHQVAHLAEVLVQPGGVRAFLTWKPFSITSFRMLSELAHDGPAFNAIIDGGANKGQFARAATETFPDAKVFAFEPLPDVFEELKANLGRRPQVTVIQSALGNQQGTIEFFRHGYSLSSSVLRPLKTRPGTDIQALEVPVCRLDDALKDVTLPGPALLKLDLQGYEMEALRGASELLRRVSHVLVETSFIPSYEGEPAFGETLEFLRQAGFTFVRPLDLLRDDAGTIIQVDALFARDVGPDALAPNQERL